MKKRDDVIILILLLILLIGAIYFNVEKTGQQFSRRARVCQEGWICIDSDTRGYQALDFSVLDFNGQPLCGILSRVDCGTNEICENGICVDEPLQFTDAYWDVENAERGERVFLTVECNVDCEDARIKFEIWKDLAVDELIKVVEPSNIVGNVVSSRWTVPIDFTVGSRIYFKVISERFPNIKRDSSKIFIQRSEAECDPDEGCGDEDRIGLDCGVGCLGYWSFDDNDRSATHVFDLSGNNFLGEINGDLTFVPRANGDSASFDGDEDFIEIFDSNNYLSGMQEFSVAFWMRRNEIPSSGETYLFKNYVWGPYSFRTFAGGIEVRPFMRNLDMEFTPKPSEVVVFFGEFFHYAFVYDGTMCKQYLNGLLIFDEPCAPDGLSSLTGSLFVGKENTGENSYSSFNGEMDELMIFNRALEDRDFSVLRDSFGCGNGVCSENEHYLVCQEDCFNFDLTGSIVQDSDYNIWYADATLKVLPDFIPPSTQASSVDVSMAQNEIRFVQLAVSSNVDRNVVVSVSGVPSGFSVDTYVEGLVNISDPSTCYLEECSLVQLFSGQIPDPLLKTSIIDLDVGKTSVVLVEISTKGIAAPGAYSFDVLIDGKTIPVNVKVYDFAIPDEPSLKTAYDSGHFHTRANDLCTGLSLADFHGVPEGSPTNTRKLVDAYYEDYAEHRLSPYSPQEFREINYDCDSNTFDFSDFDFAMERYLDDLNMSAVMIRHMGGGTYKVGFPLCGLKINEPGYEEFAIAYYSNISQHLVEEGWYDKSYIMLDEPNATYLGDVKDFTEILTKKVIPPFKIGPTFGLDETYEILNGSINLWIPINDEHRDIYDPALAQTLANQGDEIWWYYIRSRVLNIDAVAVDNIVAPWMAWKYDISGLLTWGGLIYDMHCSENDEFGYNNPWYQPRSTWGNGQINLYYPPCVDECTTPTFDVVPSLRLKLLREGLQDYEYIKMLEDLDPNNPSLNRVNEIVLSNKLWNNDASLLVDVRKEIAEQIESLNQASASTNDEREKTYVADLY